MNFILPLKENAFTDNTDPNSQTNMHLKEFTQLNNNDQRQTNQYM